MSGSVIDETKDVCSVFALYFSCLSSLSQAKLSNSAVEPKTYFYVLSKIFRLFFFQLVKSSQIYSPSTHSRSSDSSLLPVKSFYNKVFTQQLVSLSPASISRVQFFTWTFSKATCTPLVALHTLPPGLHAPLPTLGFLCVTEVHGM